VVKTREDTAAEVIAADPPIPPVDEQPTNSTQSADSDPAVMVMGVLGQMQQMMAGFQGQMQQMADRQRQFEQRIEEELVIARAPEPSYVPVNGQDQSHFGGVGMPVYADGPTQEDIVRQRYTDAGLIEPPSTQTPKYQGDPHDLVAFIPKDDQLNPKNRTFDTWINCRWMRIKRGEIGMMPRGHAINLAVADKGYVLDIKAMAAVTVPQLPDYARQNTWDGSVPTEAGNSVPREFYAGQ